MTRLKTKRYIADYASSSLSLFRALSLSLSLSLSDLDGYDEGTKLLHLINFMEFGPWETGGCLANQEIPCS